MPFLPTFPQEIIDKIFDELSGTKDKRILKKCSVMSSSFRIPAQRRLFQVIFITFTDIITSQDRNLLSTLASSPRLCGYVEMVFVMVQTQACDVAFASIGIPRLPWLHDITIMADHRTPGIGWMSLPAAVRRDLRDMFSRPKLRTLSIIAMKDIPIRNLQLCSNLKMLEIWDITFYTDVEPDISPVSDPPIDPTNVGSLETIWLRGDTVIQPLLVALEDASSLLSITRLRNFTVEIWDDTNFIALQAVMELVGCNLEVLKLSRLHLITGDPALPNLHNLRHIHFRLKDLASIPHVSRILESVPCPNKLEEVSIYTTLDTCTMEASAVDEGAWAWRAIDELLTRERHAKRLRRVSIVVIVMDSDEETAIEAFARQSMPQLLNLGRLCVEVDRLDHDHQVVIPLGAS